jgi:hypothetical protein
VKNQRLSFSTRSAVTTTLQVDVKKTTRRRAFCNNTRLSAELNGHHWKNPVWRERFSNKRASAIRSCDKPSDGLRAACGIERSTTSHLPRTSSVTRIPTDTQSRTSNQEPVMKTDTQLQGGMKTDDPTPPDPLSPGRTDLNPSDNPGVDELPDNEGQIPLEPNDDAPVVEEMADVDIDNAELDHQPNPR